MVFFEKKMTMQDGQGVLVDVHYIHTICNMYLSSLISKSNNTWLKLVCGGISLRGRKRTPAFRFPNTFFFFFAFEFANNTV